MMKAALVVFASCVVVGGLSESVLAKQHAIMNMQYFQYAVSNASPTSTAIRAYARRQATTPAASRSGDRLVNEVISPVCCQHRLVVSAGYFKVRKGCRQGGHPGCKKGENDELTVFCYCNDSVRSCLCCCPCNNKCCRTIATAHLQCTTGVWFL